MSYTVSSEEVLEQKLLELEGSIPLGEMENLKDLIQTSQEKLSYQLKLTHSGSEITVNGILEAQLYLACNRCLEIVRQRHQGDFKVRMVPQESIKNLADELILEDEDLDISIYEDTIDLLALMEEQILLGIPMRHLCSPGCLGICAECGENLNMKACVCSKEIPEDHPFAVLVKPPPRHRK